MSETDDQQPRVVFRPGKKLRDAVGGAKVNFSRELALPQSKIIPLGVKPVDWLIAEYSQFTMTPLARWKERNDVPFLIALANFEASYPGELRLTRRMFEMAAWQRQEVRTPFDGVSKIERKASMVGGQLWVCNRYPWPRGCARWGNENKEKWFSPVVQLNLAELDLAFLDNFPPLLVQVWGNDIDPFVRVIDLAEIDGREPDPVFRPWRNEHLFRGGSVCLDSDWQ